MGYLSGMRAVTIKEAKAHLNELVEAATKGEEVVLMRGSKHIATIVPITADDLELATRLTDDQADRLWRQLATEKEAGNLEVFETAERAVRRLSPSRRGARRSR
jgi:antitoxin (DNA-binding transcriptional repressor) of toxin-antitoxin stability system